MGLMMIIGNDDAASTMRVLFQGEAMPGRKMKQGLGVGRGVGEWGNGGMGEWVK